MPKSVTLQDDSIKIVYQPHTHLVSMAPKRDRKQKASLCDSNLQDAPRGKHVVSVVQLTIDLQSDLLFGLHKLPFQTADWSESLTTYYSHVFFFFYSWLEICVVSLSSFVPLRLLFLPSCHICL